MSFGRYNGFLFGNTSNDPTGGNMLLLDSLAKRVRHL